MLRHPSGVNFSTPILIPSFSTKGFGFQDNESEITEIISIASEWLTETMLVSAHDIHYGYIPNGFYSSVELVFVDSGGYEKNSDHDFSVVYSTAGSSYDWNENLLKNVYDSLPPDSSFVLVSYDSMGQAISEQIKNASQSLSNYGNSLRTILLKREQSEQRYIDLQSVLRYVNDLSYFDIVGLTEKELGKSLLQRMFNIARIRQELDRNSIDIPIHIFGSLDPITSILYFLAGAEIFDGLTWLRYSYLNGVATYQQNYGALKEGIHQRDDTVKAKSFVENISYLRELTYQMKGYLLEGDFRQFSHHSDFLRTSYDRLCSELGGLV